MHKLTYFSAAALLTIALSGAAQAQTVEDRGVYAGVGVNSFEFDSYTLSGKLGYNFNEYFGVEGDLGFGISEENDSIDGFDVGAGIDWYTGAFGVLRAPVTEQFDVLGRAGYYFAEVDADITNTVDNLTTDLDADTDGFAFGAGVQYNFGDGNRNGIRAEYTYLDVQEIEGTDVDEFDLGGDTYSLTYIRKF
jgi:opacity protein-like surface antigen